MGAAVLAVFACSLALTAKPAGAQSGEKWLETDDWRRWLQTQDFGGPSGDFRTIDSPSESGPSNLSRRLTAGGLSLLVPGAGQFYNDQRGKALIMVGLEAAIWGGYLGFDRYAGALSDDYRNWSSVYAGTSGEHPDSYWQAVGRYMDSDAWDDARRRQARAFDEPYPPRPTDEQQWQWRSEEHRRRFQELRADSNLAYDRRNKMLLFAILNRAIAVYDAVRNGGRPAAEDQDNAVVSALGLDLFLEVSPAVERPTARAMVGWSF
jgi:TM2 domain-containing membrane protein YozV